MTTVLETEYVEPTRPYSQDELIQARHELYRSLRLGNMKAHHRRCDHFYLAKQNGRKEKEMREQNSNDVGNCSVCWKIGKTHANLRERARNLVQAYCDEFYEEPKYLTYGAVDLENVYYQWLYEDLK
jgi:hypothetical protein